VASKLGLFEGGSLGRFPSDLGNQLKSMFLLTRYRAGQTFLQIEHPMKILILFFEGIGLIPIILRGRPHIFSGRTAIFRFVAVVQLQRCLILQVYFLLYKFLEILFDAAEVASHVLEKGLAMGLVFVVMRGYSSAVVLGEEPFLLERGSFLGEGVVL
jgi:hypothetical protein